MVKKVSFIMSFVAACLFTANAATVSGTVTRTVGGAAIAGATVTLTSTAAGTSVTAATNATGDYSFTNVTDANYPANFTISAIAPGFAASADVFVRIQNANSSVTSDIDLTAKTAGVIVSGTVTIAGTATPVAGAKVVIQTGGLGGGGTRVDSAVTGTTGTYSIDSVQAGTYSLVTSATGYTATTSNNFQVNNTALTRNLQLAAVTYDTVRGTITVQGTTTGIAGAKVVLLNGTTRVDSATSVTNGTYALPHVATGTYAITASATGYATYTSTTMNQVTVNGATVVRNISLTALPQPTTILGVVTDANTSAAVVGAKVVLLSSGTRTDSTVSATGGLYSFANVAPATYSTVTSATGYVNRTINSIPVNGTPVTSNVSLTPITSDTVRGTITIQGTSTGIAGAKVVLLSGTTRVDSATSGASGVYTIPAVASGTYAITVSATGYATYSSTNANAVQVIGATVVRNVSLTALPTPTTILGVVTNATTAAAIVGAKVVLLSGTTRVDSTVTATGGIYSFANIAAATYSTITSAAGFANRTTNNITVAGSPVTSNVTLNPITYDTVSGQVRIQGTTTGIVGATLILMDNASVSVDTVVSGVNGAYAFINVASGTYVIVTSANGYVTANTNITVTNAPIAQNISLTARALGASALGIVTSSTTAAVIVGAKVVLQQRIGTVWTPLDSTLTIAGGLYVIDSIQIGGTYRLAVSMASYTTMTQNLTVTTNGSTVTTNFALVGATGVMNLSSVAANRALSVGMIAGRLVVNNLNGPAEIRILSANGRMVFRTTITANTASVTLPKSVVAAGTYLVNITQKSGVLNKLITAQ